MKKGIPSLLNITQAYIYFSEFIYCLIFLKNKLIKKILEFTQESF